MAFLTEVLTTLCVLDASVQKSIIESFMDLENSQKSHLIYIFREDITGLIPFFNLPYKDDNLLFSIVISDLSLPTSVISQIKANKDLSDSYSKAEEVKTRMMNDRYMPEYIDGL